MVHFHRSIKLAIGNLLNLFFRFDSFYAAIETIPALKAAMRFSAGEVAGIATQLFARPAKPATPPCKQQLLQLSRPPTIIPPGGSTL